MTTQNTQAPTLGYEPIRAYIRERLKTVREPQVRVELQCIVTLCDGLEHQAELLQAALPSAFSKFDAMNGRAA